MKRLCFNNSLIFFFISLAYTVHTWSLTVHIFIQFFFHLLSKNKNNNETQNKIASNTFQQGKIHWKKLQHRYYYYTYSKSKKKKITKKSARECIVQWTKCLEKCKNKKKIVFVSFENAAGTGWAEEGNRENSSTHLSNLYVWFWHTHIRNAQSTRHDNVAKQQDRIETETETTSRRYEAFWCILVHFGVLYSFG